MPTPYYQDASVSLYLGDAFDVWPRLRAEIGAADHVITDPPYSEKTHNGARSGSTHGRLIEDADYASVTTEWVRQLLGICSPRRWTIATCDHIHCAQLEMLPPQQKGMYFVRAGCWCKSSGYAPQLSGDRPAMGWEAIAILHSTEQRPRWNGGGRAATWTDASVRNASVPGEKPESLIASFVELFTDPGELILDPCCGSGTVGRVAKDHGRRAILIERNERHAEIAAKRMRQEVML